MTEQTKHKGLYAALAAAQAEMGRALKDSNNPHFKSKYADLASVMDACMPALTRHGIAVLQPAHDEDGERFIKTIFVHGESGESVECRVPLIVAKNDMQGYGSACTYARRYGLMGMAGIAPEDDDGNAASKAPPKAADKPAEKPQEVSQHAIDAAKESLGRERTLGGLRQVFEGLPASVKAHRDVINAKDLRKGELSEAEHDDAVKKEREPDPADQDSVPYQ